MDLQSSTAMFVDRPIVHANVICIRRSVRVQQQSPNFIQASYVQLLYKAQGELHRCYDGTRRQYARFEGAKGKTQFKSDGD